MESIYCNWNNEHNDNAQSVKCVLKWVYTVVKLKH